MTDNTLVPIKDPNRGFRIWGIEEIYTGSGVGRIVPNKGDLVYSQTTGFQLVTEVDYTSGLSSTMDAPNVFPETVDGSEANRLIVGGTGRPSEAYRVYIDTSVIPHTLDINGHFHIYDSTARYVKLFKGTNVEHNGVVISRQYDQNGTLLGENIPLEVVQTANPDNVAIQTPMSGYSSEALMDGETVTAVVYGDAGAKLSITQFIVQNTSWIRTTNPSVKYVTGIELLSPFLSASDNKTIECPINLPLEHIARQGKVTYSDNSNKVLPIDGVRFALHGSTNFVSTLLGQKAPATLVYYLAEDETAYTSIDGTSRHLDRPYTLTTTKVDGTYSVKIFTYPVWVDAISGYRLEHWLLNLDRDEVYNVTSLVEQAANSLTFDPTAYGVAQDLVFALDLSKVDVTFKGYRHLQSTRINLHAPGSDVAPTNWTVQFDRSKDPYGINVRAESTFVNSNLWHLNVGSGFGSMEDWLRNVYEASLPLYDYTAEDGPLVPTHFKIIAGTYESEWPVSEWDRDFVVNNTLNIGQCVYVQFLRRTAQTDLMLGVSGMIIKQTN